MKRHKISVILVVIAVMAAVIFFGTSSLEQTASASTTKHKYYTSITIEADDSLWSIAERYAAPESGSYNSFIEEVKQINDLKGDTINYGEALVIPQYK